MSEKDSNIRVSKISKRLQIVGSHVLMRPEIIEVEEGVFSNHGEEGTSLGDRLVIANETKQPLVEVVSVNRGGEFADGIFKVLGIKPGDPLIAQVGCSIERDDSYSFGGKEYEFAAVGLEIPGEHIISLDGKYRPLVKSYYEHTTYDTPYLDASGRMKGGGYGSSYGYEGGPSFLSGPREMEAILSLLEAENRAMKIGRRGVFDWMLGRG